MGRPPRPQRALRTRRHQTSTSTGSRSSRRNGSSATSAPIRATRSRSTRSSAQLEPLRRHHDHRSSPPARRRRPRRPLYRRNGACLSQPRRRGIHQRAASRRRPGARLRALVLERPSRRRLQVACRYRRLRTRTYRDPAAGATPPVASRATGPRATSPTPSVLSVQSRPVAHQLHGATTYTSSTCCSSRSTSRPSHGVSSWSSDSWRNAPAHGGRRGPSAPMPRLPRGWR